MDKKFKVFAQEIRKEMTTEKAGCYRLTKLPKSATLDSISELIFALKGQKGGNEAWQSVYASDLYNKDGADYCCILAHICTNKKLEIDRL